MCTVTRSLPRVAPGPDPAVARRRRARRRLLTATPLVAAVAVVLLMLWPSAPSRHAGVAPVPAHVPDRFPVLGSLAWPASGESAVVVGGVARQGPGGTARVPIASVAKLMTAYVVLHDHPLVGDASGPVLVVDADEAADSATRRSGGQSVLGITPGEQITERQALEALLLPSANDVAQVLARWDAGDVAAFVRTENLQAGALGLRHTTYTDPSGFLATTVSDAGDQARLLTAATRVPVLMAILGSTTAVMPGGRVVHNTDTLLGRDGILAGKTGSTLAAGGCFAFVAVRTVDGRRVTVTGAVLGQPGPGLIQASLRATRTLVRSIGVTT